jgi:hypothetical protein
MCCCLNLHRLHHRRGPFLEECGDLLSVAATLEVKYHAPNIQSPLTREIQDWDKVNLSSDCFSSGLFQKCIETE